MNRMEKLLLAIGGGLFLTCMGVFFVLPPDAGKGILVILIPITAIFLMGAGVVFGRNAVIRRKNLLKRKRTGTR